MLTETERDVVLTEMRDGHDVLVVTPSLEQRPVLDQLAAHASTTERVRKANGYEGIDGAGRIRVLSVRSVRSGAGRGLTFDTVMFLDDDACDDPAVLDTVMPALVVSGGHLVCRAHGAR